MKKMMLLAFSIFLSAAMFSCSKSGSETTRYSVTVSPIRSSWPIMREASGQWEIVGEAVLNNTGTEPAVIQSVNIKVLDTTGAVLADRSYGTEMFSDMNEIFMKSPDGTYSQVSASGSDLAPGDLGFSHVAALAGTSSLPALARVTVTFTNDKSEAANIPLYEFDPGQQMIWPLSFSNGDWLAFDTGDSNYHWKTISYSAAVGDFVIDQRYAMDVMQVDAQYYISNPPGSPNKEDYYAWGEDIMSVGSGTVVAVIFDQIDQEISKIWTPAETTGTNVMGNYVIIKHRAGLFSLYVHMMQNSATVSVGDHVEAGQVIGKVGNSGLTGNLGVADGQPHLHFQFMDAKDRSKAQGLPARFSNLKVIRFSDAELLGALGFLPDIRSAYSLQTGTYGASDGTPLEYDIITAP